MGTSGNAIRSSPIDATMDDKSDSMAKKDAMAQETTGETSDGVTAPGARTDATEAPTEAQNHSRDDTTDTTNTCESFSPLCCLAATFSCGIGQWDCAFNQNNQVTFCGSSLGDCCILFTGCGGCGIWGCWASAVHAAFCCQPFAYMCCCCSWKTGPPSERECEMPCCHRTQEPKCICCSCRCC